MGSAANMGGRFGAAETMSHLSRTRPGSSTIPNQRQSRPTQASEYQRREEFCRLLSRDAGTCRGRATLSRPQTVGATTDLPLAVLCAF